MSPDPSELELEELAVRARLEELVAELGIYSPNVQASMRLEPLRAVELMEYARTRGLASPAGFVVARFRDGWTPPAPAVEEELEPLTEAELEAGLAFARRYGAPAFAIECMERQLSEVQTAPA